MAERIYTRTGDTGETGLFGGGRVSKSESRIAACGEIDELNAALGVAIALLDEPGLRARVESIQPDLLTVGAHLATPAAPPGGNVPKGLPPLPDARVGVLEEWIDQAQAELPPLREFILPGGCAAGAALHLGRTICRRAERSVVRLAAEPDAAVPPAILAYINRLSDLLFVWARLTNQRAGLPESRWRPHTG